jgi:hypothetical protein
MTKRQRIITQRILGRVITDSFSLYDYELAEDADGTIKPIQVILTTSFHDKDFRKKVIRSLISHLENMIKE